MNLICPGCKISFSIETDRLKCPQCKRKYKIIDGIPYLIKTEDYYFDFNNIPPRLMRDLAKRTAQSGYENALECLFSSVRYNLEELKASILDKRQTFWKLLVSLPSQGTVLELGCGWGNTAVELAQLCDKIICMDLIPDRLRFVALRLKEVGITNVEFILGGDSFPLPFPDASFDMVVMNGFLGYAGVLYDGHPGQIQQMILTDAHRLLKAGGCLYVGIENRFGYQYFLGKRDEYSSLRFTSLLPRFLAHLYSYLLKQQKYYGYTRSFNGYKELLSQSGFSQIKFFFPVPNYRIFNYIIPLEEQNVINYWITHSDRTMLLKKVEFLLTKVLIRMGLFKHLIPSFGIICYK